MAGFLAMPWLWLGVGAALLLLTGWAMVERHGRQAERARAESLEDAVQTYIRTIESDRAAIAVQNKAVEKMKADAGRLVATTRAAVAAARQEVRRAEDEAARLRARLGAPETLTCEAGVAEVKLGL